MKLLWGALFGDWIVSCELQQTTRSKQTYTAKKDIQTTEDEEKENSWNKHCVLSDEKNVYRFYKTKRRNEISQINVQKKHNSINWTWKLIHCIKRNQKQNDW